MEKAGVCADKSALERTQRIASLINELGGSKDFTEFKKMVIDILNELNVRQDDLEHTFEQLPKMG